MNAARCRWQEIVVAVVDFHIQGRASVRPTRRSGPDRHGGVRHGADTARHDPTLNGMAQPGLADRSEVSGQ